MPPTCRVQVRSLSRHPAKHAMKSLTCCHATNIKGTSEPLRRHPTKHTMKSPTSCHATTIKCASEVIRHPAKHVMKPLTSCHATNIRSASEVIEQTLSQTCHEITHKLSCHQHQECKVRQLSRHPNKHAMNPLTPCHSTHIKSASEAIEWTSS
ncbi:hypothetical protein BKA82DRAFT_2974840 [Pisolithus tinctorius]|nr:hypothetical protein BKA82DRAFT_2974840 [Pisolithus tinctorius]